ncbi:MAG: VWA domain-containing protein [Gemmatimonadota bacterium]|nr:VWA domain-containing protein [Gemmatimonadota bacterium]
MRLHRLLRNRAIGIARRLLAPARRSARTPPVVPIEEMSRRIELLLAAMFGRRFSVGGTTPRPEDDAQTKYDIILPAAITAHTRGDGARAQFRLIAIEQAVRHVRGTAASELPGDPLERDLFMIAEGASIDLAIARQAPGLKDSIAELRRADLAGRPPLTRLRGGEREVEALLQQTLAADPASTRRVGLETNTPGESRAWARAEAERIRAAAAGRPYRRVRAVGRWQLAEGAVSGLAPWAAPSPIVGDRRTAATSSESSQGKGGGESGDGDEAVPVMEESEGRSAVAAASAAAEERSTHPQDRSAPTPGGVHYREWDEYADRYRPAEVTVHASVAAETDDAWAAATLRDHAPIIRQIRARFEPLRAQRTRLRAQRAGDELDLDACVAALVEMRRGHIPSDRLYQLTKPARRTMAILLLVDVSGSTDSPVSPGRTVLDVERTTLLLASEALDALSDPYAVLAFSSSGRHDVQVDTMKSFIERDPSRLRRRVSALTSGRNTRLGAAIRHATTVLNAQPAERRLLLILSDGQPNDVGGYQGSYAVGDSRRAVLEARAAGVHTFCLTVDREEAEYLPHLFGVNGYRVLRSPEQLPEALLQLVVSMLPG